MVRDPTIVNAYLRQRRLIDDQESSTEALMPSDDPEKNRMAKRRYVFFGRIVQLAERGLLTTCFIGEFLFFYIQH